MIYIYNYYTIIIQLCTFSIVVQTQTGKLEHVPVIREDLADQRLHVAVERLSQLVRAVPGVHRKLLTQGGEAL